MLFLLQNKIRLILFMTLLLMTELHPTILMCHLLSMQFLILAIYMFLIFFLNAAFISWVICVLWHLTSCFLEKNSWNLIGWSKAMPMFMAFNSYCHIARRQLPAGTAHPTFPSARGLLMLCCYQYGTWSSYESLQSQ